MSSSFFRCGRQDAESFGIPSSFLLKNFNLQNLWIRSYSILVVVFLLFSSSHYSAPSSNGIQKNFVE